MQRQSILFFAVLKHMCCVGADEMPCAQAQKLQRVPHCSTEVTPQNCLHMQNVPETERIKEH